MKALSLYQPWASAVAIGAKNIETRSWWTGYRGPIAIHATKTDNEELREFFTWHVCDPLRKAGYSSFDALPLGAVVATCRLVECLRTTDIGVLTKQERDFGDYTAGRYGWVFQDIRALAKPIPARGAQQLWEWHDPQFYDSELSESKQ